MRLEARPLLAGVVAAAALVSIYLTLVVLATPTITPGLALELSLSANWLYIVLMASLTGLQAYLAVFSRTLPCRLQKTNAVGASSSVAASFTSFFGLTSVGCCGLFPFWISLVFGGGAFGAGASSFLVEYSTPLTVLGISVMVASIGFTIRRIRESLHQSQPGSLNGGMMTGEGRLAE